MVLQSAGLVRRRFGHGQNTLLAEHSLAANSVQVQAAPSLEVQVSHMAAVLQELVCKSFAGGQADTKQR